MKRRLHFQIPRDRAGIGLIDFLAIRFPYHTRSGWLERCVAGRIFVNDRPALPDHVLAYRDRLDYLAGDRAEPNVRFDVGVIHDDAELLVVNKPPNLPCHPAGRYFEHTLSAWAVRNAGIDAPIFVNRIDRETSGLVVMARTPAAAKRCRAEFASHRAEKHYVVLVEGAFPEVVTAQGWLVADDAGPVRKRRRFVPGTPEEAGRPGGEWCVTHLRLTAVHGPISEVAVTLETGRLHQIRATLLGLGYPVVGDKLYGPDPRIFLRFCTDTMTEDDRRHLRLARQALHAERLVYRHPRTSDPLDLHAPMPEDMKALIEEMNLELRNSRHDGELGR